MIAELILSIVISWLFVKIVKFIIFWHKAKEFSLNFFLYDGGMPSSHTVLVVSLATALFIETGLSYVFAISVVLALIVMSDAIKVRRVTEEQSKVLNKLQKDKKLDEHVGHKPIEVLVGVVLGIIIPIIVYALL